MNYYSYVAGLICVGALMVGDPGPETQRAVGLNVLLAHRCPEDGTVRDSREWVVRELVNGSLRLNQQALDEGTLRKQVFQIMQPSQEKLLWIAADERLGYGEVVALISTLLQDSPDLNVALATKAQTGPIDPTEIARLEASHDYEREPVGVGGLCVGPPSRRP